MYKNEKRILASKQILIIVISDVEYNFFLTKERNHNEDADNCKSTEWIF